MNVRVSEVMELVIQAIVDEFLQGLEVLGTSPLGGKTI